jgi:hypothetical protein
MTAGWPTFLGIGAQKGGTSAVHQFLLSHPQIFLPTQKELRYFAHADRPLAYTGPGDERMPRVVVRTWEEYLGAFRGSERFPVRGEISPEYLVLADRSAPEIRRRLPEAKLFAVLRQPVDRAYSNFQHAIRMGREPLADFRSALAAEEKRIADGWSPFFWYRRNGEYGRQLAEFYKVFPKERIRIYLYDDLRGDPGALMADLFRFLGADPAHRVDFAMEFNSSGIPRNQGLYQILFWLRRTTRFTDRLIPISLRYPVHAAMRRAILRPAPRLSPADRKELTEGFRSEIERLQDLIGRDLGSWLSPPEEAAGRAGRASGPAVRRAR